MIRKPAALSFVLVAACTVAACQSPHDDFVRTVTELRSWASASHMVIDRWQTRAVPTHYARDAIKAAQEELPGQIAKLGKLQGVDAAERAEAGKLARDLLSVCDELRQAVEQNSGDKASAARQKLAAIESDLARLLRFEGAGL